MKMIIDAFVTLIVSVINFIINLLPTYDPSVNDFISSKIGVFRGYLITNNWWFPVDDLFNIIRLSIVLATTLVLWLAVRFIAHSITLGKVK